MRLSLEWDVFEFLYLTYLDGFDYSYACDWSILYVYSNRTFTSRYMCFL